MEFSTDGGGAHRATIEYFSSTCEFSIGAGGLWNSLADVQYQTNAKEIKFIGGNGKRWWTFLSDELGSRVECLNVSE